MDGAVNNQGDSAAQAGTSWTATVAGDEARIRHLADVFEAANAEGDIAIAAYEHDGAWMLSLHFPERPDEASCRALVLEVAGPDLAARLQFSPLAQEDWVANSLAGLKPVSCGRVLVHGGHDRHRVAANRIGIEIEAALAFGTGHHGTTLGCLMLMERLFRTRQPERILDLGTGTAVLAIAAARQLRHAVLATDIDPVAVDVARDNAVLNGTAGLIDCIVAAGFHADAFARGAQFDLIIANILAEPLRRLAAPMRRHAAPGAHVVLSGILPTQADAVIAAYRAQGFRLLQRLPLDGWTSLLLRRI